MDETLNWYRVCCCFEATDGPGGAGVASALSNRMKWTVLLLSPTATSKSEQQFKSDHSCAIFLVLFGVGEHKGLGKMNIRARDCIVEKK